jgi:hypothetical protein
MVKHYNSENLSNNVAKDVTIAFLEYKLLYVNAIFEIIALMKPVQLNESSVSDAIDTPRLKFIHNYHYESELQSYKNLIHELYEYEARTQTQTRTLK